MLNYNCKAIDSDDTPPVAQLLTPDEIREHLKQPASGHTNPLTYSEYQNAARFFWEQDTDMALVPTTYQQTHNDRYTVPCLPIKLMRHPFVELLSVKYIDPDGVEQTAIEGTDYRLNTRPRLVELHWLKSLRLKPVYPTITIEFVAGNDDLDPAAKVALLILTSFFYQNPEGMPECLPPVYWAIRDKYWHGREWA